MSEENDSQSADIIGLTADIVAAFVQNNSVPIAGLPALISSVNAALAGLTRPVVAEQPALAPAVNPKKSVTRDAIVCLEDGKRFKSLKRHLSSHHGMTPDEYRTKWDLPKDYPMVAPAYAEQRSALAVSIGLGRKAAAKKAPVKRKPRK